MTAIAEHSSAFRRDYLVCAASALWPSKHALSAESLGGHGVLCHVGQRLLSFLATGSVVPGLLRSSKTVRLYNDVWKRYKKEETFVSKGFFFLTSMVCV